MLITLPLIATLKEHVQTLNPLLYRGFGEIRAADFYFLSALSNNELQ